VKVGITRPDRTFSGEEKRESPPEKGEKKGVGGKGGLFRDKRESEAG